MPTRRNFLLGGAVAVSGLLAASRARVSDVRTISLQPEFYHGWPTLIRSRAGDLLLVYSGGRESHVCPFGRVDLMRSHDDGKTWSWPETLMDSAIDDRDAGICETSSGALLVTTFTSLTYESRMKNLTPEQQAKWVAVDRRITAAQRRELQDTWMLRSSDAGVSWSAPFRVPANSPHGPILLSGGRLLYAGKKLWEEGGRVGVCESIDDGKTWRWLSDIPARPGDSVKEYHELHAVQAANNHVIVHIRNHNQQNAGETLQCESADGGRTWSVPRAIGVWGLPSHLLRLRDGRLLMTYGYRRPPFGNQARVSTDNGQTWSEPMTLSDDAMSVDVGYPSTVESGDGSLVTVWYETLKSSPKAVLRQAAWRLE
jgi:Neuraminidase (sialidase)